MRVAPEGHAAFLETVGLQHVVGVAAHAAQHADGVPVALQGDTVPGGLLRIVDRLRPSATPSIPMPIAILAPRETTP